MDKSEIIACLSIVSVSILISWTLIKLRNAFWGALAFWSLSTITWAIYNLSAPNPLWFITDYELVSLYGFLGNVGLGVYISIQTFTMFEIAATFSNEHWSSSFMVISTGLFCAGIMLCFIQAGYFDYSWLIILLLIAGGTFLLINFFDDMNDFVEEIILFAVISVLGGAYVYTFPSISQSPFAIVVGGILFIFLFKESEGAFAITELGPRRRGHSSHIAADSNSDKPVTALSEEDDKGDEPQMVITFKGRYHLNGPKTISRKIRCSISESKNYTSYIYDKNAQASWIQTHYPGADMSKDWSLAVNITKA